MGSEETNGCCVYRSDIGHLQKQHLLCHMHLARNFCKAVLNIKLELMVSQNLFLKSAYCKYLIRLAHKCQTNECE